MLQKQSDRVQIPVVIYHLVDIKEVAYNSQQLPKKIRNVARCKNKPQERSDPF